MRKITDEAEVKATKEYLLNAAIYAMTFSKCTKSQRGAIIVKEGKIISRGYNKPLNEEYCNPCIRENIKDKSRVEICSAIHAEQMAILLANKRELKDSVMYHIAVKNGKMVPSGKPSCSVCSRLVKFVGISEFVLWHENGYFAYPTDEFNKMSLDYFLKK